jgi:opacity protein-like surface antigen
MKTLLITAAAAAALSATAASAQAIDPQWYVRGDVGGTFSSRIDGNNGPRSDGGWAVDVGVGRSLGTGFRAEGEALYLDGKGKSGSADIQTTGALLNGYYDFLPGSAWQPYVGAGVGVAQVRTSGGTLAPHGNDTRFAYQFKVGVSHPFNDRLTGDLAYRYLGVNDIRIGTGAGALRGTYDTSAITVGLRYKLGGF